MKKRIVALLFTALLVFAFSVTCFAKISPTPETIPTEETTGDAANTTPKNPNKSSTSPKTGVEMTGALVAVITAAGVALVSKKKLSENN
jgi:hypothetical protein